MFIEKENSFAPSNNIDIFLLLKTVEILFTITSSSSLFIRHQA